MNSTATASMFDRISGPLGIVRLAADHLDARGDADLAHVAGALGVAVELLDQLADEAMTVNTLTKPRSARRATR